MDETTEKLAREAGIDVFEHHPSVYERFAALVRADERERCAKKVEDFPLWLGTARERIAAALRSVEATNG